MVQQLSPESSEKARNSQVTAILSKGLKQVMTLLLLLRFATQLLRKEGISVPELQSSKYWDATIVMLNWHSEFIHSDTNWKIDVWKTGGLLFFPTASISSDMTQPADNIILITTRHMSKTVIPNNDVVHYAADMQTQSTTRNDKDQAIANQHNTIVIKEIINGEERASASDASKHFCRQSTIQPIQAPVIIATKNQHHIRRGLFSCVEKWK